MIQLPPAGSRLVTINRNFIRRSRWATANTHRTVQLIFFYLKCWCHFGCQMTFLDAIASPSSYPCQSVGQWVSESFIVSDLEIAIASLTLLTFYWLLLTSTDSLLAFFWLFYCQQNFNYLGILEVSEYLFSNFEGFGLSYRSVCQVHATSPIGLLLDKLIIINWPFWSDWETVTL